MGEIMNSPKGVKSGAPEGVSISCPTCGTRHDLHKITGNQSHVKVGEQTLQHMWEGGGGGAYVKFVNKVCMMTIEVRNWHHSPTSTPNAHPM